MSIACVFDNAKPLVSDLVDQILDEAEQWRIASAKELRNVPLHTRSPDSAAPLAAAAQLGVVLAISVTVFLGWFCLFISITSLCLASFFFLCRFWPLVVQLLCLLGIYSNRMSRFRE
jgi:hypothetical protein